MRKSANDGDPSARLADEITVEAEALVRLWDRADDWTVPRIPPSQLKILSVLRHHGQMNLKSLAAEFGAIPSSTSRLCDRLEASGLVRRDVPPTNRREVLLSLTPLARRRLDAFDDVRREDFAQVLDHMSLEARTDLLTGLRQFAIAAGTAREQSA